MQSGMSDYSDARGSAASGKRLIDEAAARQRRLYLLESLEKTC
jgi:hypothetical protein